MEKYILLFLLICSTPMTLLAADTCSTLPSFKSLDCKNEAAVETALNELHTCMKERFEFKDTVYSAAWPQITVPETGKITGGDGEWAIATLEAFPCKEKRLAFIQKDDNLPYLTMVSGVFIVDFNMDKVYKASKLAHHKILKVSGLQPDQPWFKVD